MRGILAHAAYVPYRRLDRAAITAFMGSGGGRGHRSVASFDEDTTTMAFEAGRQALRTAGGVVPAALTFSTADPAYIDRTNATAIHAALRLPRTSGAIDMGSSQRSATGALQAALDGSPPVLVTAADIRMGLPTSADEAAGGDGAAALLIGNDTDGDLLAELVGSAGLTDEAVLTWRGPGETRLRHWDDKFAETVLTPLATEAYASALDSAGITAAKVSAGVVTGLEARPVRTVAKKLGLGTGAITAAVGNLGTAAPMAELSAMLESAKANQTLALVVLADGVQVFLFRTTKANTRYKPTRPVAEQIASFGEVSYSRFLNWRGILQPEPPRRPEPDRPSASAAYRNDDWKFGFVGSRDKTSGAVHLPPSRASITGGGVDNMEPVPMADAIGTVVTFTIDKLVYSLSPPVVFAIVDFADGGRAPIEITDVDPDGLAIGDQVEMTFRRLFAADGIHNYFWKGRPVRIAPPARKKPAKKTTVKKPAKKTTAKQTTKKTAATKKKTASKKGRA